MCILLIIWKFFYSLVDITVPEKISSNFVLPLTCFLEGPRTTKGFLFLVLSTLEKGRVIGIFFFVFSSSWFEIGMFIIAVPNWLSVKMSIWDTNINLCLRKWFSLLQVCRFLSCAYIGVSDPSPLSGTKKKASTHICGAYLELNKIEMSYYRLSFWQQSVALKYF